MNLVNYLVREEKKNYFQDLAGNNLDISSMWRAINTLTKGHLPSAFTPDVFNAHFVSVVSKFLPDGHSDGPQYSCSDKLPGFCHNRTSQHNTFSIPPLSVLEVGIAISKIDNKKSTGCCGISVKLQKLLYLTWLGRLHLYKTCAHKITLF